MLLRVAFCLFACSSAHADLKKCIDPQGKVTYSDVACLGGSVPMRATNAMANTVDGTGFRMEVHKEASERERIAQEDLNRRQLQAQASEKSSQTAAAADKAAVAYANCVRDVERQGAPESVKAELFAACRTAGQSQRQTGLTDVALRDCVRNVERTGATGKDKARQLATCHGADVKPEPIALLPAAAFSAAK